jgi:gentisate 1,2-dioxygenase
MTRAQDTARESAEAFSQRVANAGLVPLWTFFKEWFAAEPQAAALPYLWRYAELRPVVMDAAEAVSTQDAERRVLVLENPGLRGRHLATDALYAGLQLIMPGEFARTHRHTAAALRFIVEGENTYTAVAGERCYMRPGDFIVTPSWIWHEHRNEGREPTIWLDVLDVPLIRFLGAGFSEHYPDAEYPTVVPPGDSQLRYGRNLVPVGFKRVAGASPVFAYPFDYAYEALEHLREHGDWDACHGVKMRYTNPVNGDYAMSTMGTFIQLLPKGFASSRYRATDATVFVPVEGRGRSRIGDTVLEWGPKDVFVVPSWHPVSHEASEDAVLFSYSDRPVQEKLGLFREDRGNA